MVAILHVGSVSTGHDGYPPTTAKEGSQTVFVNGFPINRKGDEWLVHCRTSCHFGATVTPDTRTVYADGIPIGLVGDSISCGDTAGTGSPDVSGGN